MALFAAGRRAASSTAPLLRPLAAAAAAARSMPLSSVPSAMPSSDGMLVRIVDSEINGIEEYHRVLAGMQVKRISSFPFEITDKKGTKEITLTRTYNDEEIEIEVSKSEPDVEEDETSHESDSDQVAETHNANELLDLTVTISKGDGRSLEFTCTAYPDEIIINTLSMSRPEDEEEDDDEIAYKGPDFDDLDENIQREMYKYLELRGITPMAANFLHQYMRNKNRWEYLFWLRKLKDFV